MYQECNASAKESEVPATSGATCVRNTLPHEKVTASLLGLHVGNTYVEHEKVAAPAASRSVIPTWPHEKVADHEVDPAVATQVCHT